MKAFTVGSCRASLLLLNVRERSGIMRFPDIPGPAPDMTDKGPYHSYNMSGGAAQDTPASLLIHGNTNKQSLILSCKSSWSAPETSRAQYHTGVVLVRYRYQSRSFYSRIEPPTISWALASRIGTNKRLVTCC